MNKQIKDFVTKLANQLKDSEQLSTAALAIKLKKYASSYPEDKTLGALSVVVHSLAKHNDFIKKQAFKDLYNKHYTNNTVASQLLSKELDIEFQKEAEVSKQSNKLDLSKYNADPLLQKVIASAVFKESKVSATSELIKKAEYKVNSTLNDLIRPINVKTIDSNKNAILVLASYETPKGITDIFVPLTNNLEGNVFVGNNTVKELNKDNLKDYILSNAGKKLSISSKKVLSMLEQNPEESKSELAAAKLKIKNAQVAGDGIVGYILPDNKAETIVEIPRSGEFKTLEEKFASPLGIALENFGERVLQRATKVAESTLNQINSNPAKISLLKSSESTLIFNVLSKSGKAFTLPIKVSGSNCLSPEYAIVDGTVTKLDRDFENKLASSNLDVESFVNVAQLATLNPSQLIECAKHFTNQKEFDKVAVVLDVLKEKDIDLYKNAYKHILGLEKEASVKHVGCNKLVKRANSLHKVCSHTGLPENKIYQDEDGVCQPLYRKEIKANAEGAFYMTSKILG